MPRLLKFAALTAGAFLLLLSAAGLVVHLRVDPNDYKDDIVKLVRERHQRTLSIPDAVSLTFYPRIGADLGRVTLSERGSSATFAVIERARVSVALLPLLLRGDMVIDRVDLRGVRAQVVRLADGSMTTGDLTSARMASAATTDAHGHSPVTMAISSIRVSAAQVHFDDRKGGRVYDIGNLNIESGPVARGTPSRIALSANVGVSRPALHAAVTLDARFMPSLEHRQVAFTDFDANLDLSFKNAKIKLTGQVDVDLDKDEFATAMKGKFDDSTFDLQAGFRAGAYHLTMHVDRVDLGRYQNRLVPDALPDDPTILEAGDAFDLSPLSMLRASGGVHVGALQIGAMHAANVRAALRSGGGKFVLQPIGASVYGGTGTGSLTLDFSRSASTPQLTFVAAMNRIEFASLLKDLIGRAPLAGRGDASVDVNTQGASTAQMRQALAGTASFRMGQGTLQGVDVAGMLPGLKASARTAGASTAFNQLAASFTIADGVAHNADLTMRTPLFSATGVGDIDLAHEQLNVTLACTENVSGQMLPLKGSGLWDALTWRVDSGAVSGAAMRQKASDSLKQTIRGILKR